MKIMVTMNGAGKIVGIDEVNEKQLRRFNAHLRGLAAGEIAEFEFTIGRNYRFHKKFFAMLGVGFDAWEPRRKKYKGHPVQKNFERFRKDTVIAAGFYEIVATKSGGVRHEAKSISFASMEEAEFELVYNAVAQVLLEGVLGNYSRADLDQVVERLMKFTE